MRVTVAILLSRPQYARDLLRYWEHQTYADRELLVLENGAGVGSWKGPGSVLQGPCDVVALRNLALEATGSGLLAYFDDDDYYGSRYLSEAVATLVQTGSPWCGKRERFLHTGTDRLWCLVPGPTREPLEVSTATLVLDVSRSVPFRRSREPWGEDRRWCLEMADAGHHGVTTSRYHYAYRRDAEHLWPASSRQLAALTEELGGTVLDYGYWNPALVDGADAHPVRIDPGAWEPLEDPQVREAIRDFGRDRAAQMVSS